MPDLPGSDDAPVADDSPFATVDLNRTPLRGDPFNPDPPDPANANLDGGQVLYHMALGAQPEDFHPALQPLAQGYGVAFEPKMASGPNLLGWPDAIRQAIGQAPPASQDDDSDRDNDQDDDDDGGDDGHESDRDASGDAAPATVQAAARAPARPYPKTLDPIVERHVAEYNQAHGLKPGDRAYLDPDLIKAMIRQESGYNSDALDHDPMQVNNAGDWTNEKKVQLGLSKGIAPGADAGVKAGIAWLVRKAYPHDDQGAPHFAGWPSGVRAYNGRNAAGTAYARSVMNHLAEIKGGH